MRQNANAYNEWSSRKRRKPVESKRKSTGKLIG
jgi:hypothetical protein